LNAMKMRSSINIKIFMPLVGGFLLLLVLFLLLAISLQREKRLVLNNITSTQDATVALEDLEDTEARMDTLAETYRYGRDASVLGELGQMEQRRAALLQEISPNLSGPLERDLLTAYESGVKDSQASLLEMAAASDAKDSQRFDRAYESWLAERKVVDEALDGFKNRFNSRLGDDISAFRQVITEVMLMFLLILAVSGLLIYLLYVYLNRLIIRPIHELIDGTKHVAEENLDWNIGVHSSDEIGKLSLAFNEMVGKLKDSYTNLKTLAFHDPLTNLPNRQVLEQKLQDSMAAAKREGKVLGVLLMDLDRFKKINDTLGHDVGDMVLKEVANRLRDRMRQEDTVVRLGGDEFVILAPGLGSVKDAVAVADRVLKALEEVVVLAEKQLYINGSIGIALYPNDGESASVLIKNADIALYGAKAAGRNRYNFYNKLTDLRPAAQLELENDLRGALNSDQLKVYFQPLVNLGTGKVTTVEALLRWQHPTLGLLLPHEFIPLAEEIGIIGRLGEWALKTAGRNFLSCQKLREENVLLALNLSPAQFLEDNLVENISNGLREINFPASSLILEITESLAMTDPEKSREKMKRLSEMGIAISIDDFGIGYSSLGSIKEFAAKRIKIDRSFIRHIITDQQDTAIVKAIIAMGHNLKLIVAAEGAETDTQLALLKSLDCDEVQGYIIARPMPWKDFERWFLGRDIPLSETPNAVENEPAAEVAGGNVD